MLILYGDTLMPKLHADNLVFLQLELLLILSLPIMYQLLLMHPSELVEICQICWN